MLRYDGDGPDPLLPEEEREVLRKEAGDDFEAEALALTRDNTEAKIRELIGRAFVAGVNLTQRGKIAEAVAKNTTPAKPKVNKMWTELDADNRRVDRAKAKMGTGVAVVNEDYFHDIADYAVRQIAAKNAESPFLFQHVGELSKVRTKDGAPQIKKVSEKRFAHLLNSCSRFVRVSGEGNSVGVSAPFDVVNHLLGTDL
ncbi:MAG: hypothetical protein GC146_16295 [Limimaricola sp.]|uniref:hypothetical protein n=1 Tax=Limimaricola sp. TaxID=2211665 RepID=UPI001D1FCE07|nr:hypothetical protein [Limimaricola sp.]MBI1418777.1 hypothetical protein [Limimaricola sp.]